jgi:hypothetical protein
MKEQKTLSALQTNRSIFNGGWGGGGQAVFFVHSLNRMDFTKKSDLGGDTVKVVTSPRSDRSVPKPAAPIQALPNSFRINYLLEQEKYQNSLLLSCITVLVDVAVLLVA